MQNKVYGVLLGKINWELIKLSAASNGIHC